MRYSYHLLLSVLLLSACSTFKGLQSLESSIQCIGSVGMVEEGLFSKSFQKIGEPHIKNPISVSIRSREFNKTAFKTYKDYRESQGKNATVTFADSLETKPRYFEIELSDLVGLKGFLNNEQNSGLLAYLEDDKNIKMLSGISFVAQMVDEQQLKGAHYINLIQGSQGLFLQINNGSSTYEISMKNLQVFDFETAGFCWQRNRRNKPEIAVIAVNGQSCPRGTEKNASKLDETKQYLKL